MREVCVKLMLVSDSTSRNADYYQVGFYCDSAKVNKRKIETVGNISELLLSLYLKESYIVLVIIHI